MSTPTIRRVATGGASVVAAVLLGCAVAWACSPSASIWLGNYTGAPGSQVLVKGSTMPEGNTVRIRWIDEQGTVLRTIPSLASSFSVAVTIPADATPGERTIFVGVYREGEAAAQPGWHRSLSFEVTEPSPSGTGNTDGSGGSGGSGGADPVTSSASSGSEATETAPQNAPSRARQNPPAGAQQTAPAGGSQAGSGTTSEASGIATVQGSERIPEAARTLPASSNPGAVRAPSGRVVFGGSVVPEAPAGATALPAGDEVRPARRTVGGSLWSGFQSGTTPQQGLGVDTRSSAASDGAGSMALTGLLIGGGLLALVGGFGVAELQRRRATVTGPGQRG